MNEIKPKPKEWCGTNYMEGYNIDKVLDFLEIEEVPKGCGCGCRGTKKLAMKLGIDVGCSLGSVSGNWDNTMFDNYNEYGTYSPTISKWGK